MISLDISDANRKGIYSERYENGELNEVITTEYLDDGLSRQIHKDADGNITWIIYWRDKDNAVQL